MDAKKARVIPSALRPGADTGENEGRNFYTILVPFYLLVLAFFILLNSISEKVEKKEKVVVSSINGTFGDEARYEFGDSEIQAIKITNFSEDIMPRHNYFSPLSKVVKDALALVETNIIEAGDRMQIKLPVRDLFVPGENKILKEKEPFLIDLAREVTKLSENEKIDVEIMVSSQDFAGNNASDSLLEIFQAGLIARSLEDVGVPEKNIIVGISPDNFGEVTMNFYRRSSDEKIKLE